MGLMAAFIYRCPATGYNVQGFVADDPTMGGEDAFRSVTCTVCARVPLVNPKNWKGYRRSRTSSREVIPMNAEIRRQGGLASNLWVQFAALVIVVAVLIALAAKYIW